MKPLHAVLAVACLLAGSTWAWDTTRVLYIGNSYTNMAYSIPAGVGSMAALRGFPYYKQESIKGGRGWSAHWNEDTVALHLIKSGNWDYVVLQDGSSGTLPGGNANFWQYGRLFCDETFKAGATPLLYLTWAYEDRIPLYDSVNLVWRPYMQDTIIREYLRLADTTSSFCAPVGIVHDEIRKNWPNADLWSDGTHPNAAGLNLSCGTFFSTLFGEPAYGLPIITTDTPDSFFVRYIQQKIDTVVHRPSLARFMPPWNRPEVAAIRFLDQTYALERYFSSRVRIETRFSDNSLDTASNKFIFQSLDTAVAKIDYRGYITAVTPGETRVTARRKTAADTVLVRVYEISAGLDSLRLSFNRYAILSSDTFPLVAAGYFHQGADAYSFNANSLLEWSVDDTSLADVRNGVVFGKGTEGTLLVRAEYLGVSDTCRLALGPALSYALRINFQASATPYNFGWQFDNATQGYSATGAGWENRFSSMFSYDDRNGDNYLLKTLTMPYAYRERGYRIKAPSGAYIIKIAMGDNKNGTGGNTIYTRYGADTLIRYSGMDNFIKTDTIDVTAVNGAFDLTVLGQINYLVLISNQGVDIDSVAWDQGQRLVPFTLPDSGPVLFTPASTMSASAANQGLFEASPNPFNPATRLRFSLGKKPGAGVTMKIFDARGALVEDLTGKISANQAEWNARHRASGLYIAVLSQGGMQWKKKLMLVK